MGYLCQNERRKKDMTDSPPRAPTILDVAEMAGVAVGTVSRFLNGEVVRVGNRDVIERAIAELGFRRNAAAVAMKTDVTRIVGFMAPVSTKPSLMNRSSM